jgi:hypothetical protein
LTFVFFFFTKTTLFWIFLNREWPDLVTRSKPGIRVLDRVGFKNYGLLYFLN